LYGKAVSTRSDGQIVLVTVPRVGDGILSYCAKQSWLDQKKAAQLSASTGNGPGVSRQSLKSCPVERDSLCNLLALHEEAMRLLPIVECHRRSSPIPAQASGHLAGPRPIRCLQAPELAGRQKQGSAKPANSARETGQHGTKTRQLLTNETPDCRRKYRNNKLNASSP
jgi:hypothetical protein